MDVEAQGAGVVEEADDDAVEPSDALGDFVHQAPVGVVGGEIALEHAGITGYTAQGIADFVGHGGGHFAQGGQGLHALDLGLEALDLGQVVEDFQGAQYGAGLVADQRSAEAEGNGAVVGPLQLFFLAGQALAGFEGMQYAQFATSGQADDVGVGLAEDLFLLEAGDLLGLLVEKGDFAVEIDDQYAAAEAL